MLPSIDLASLKFAANVFDALVCFIRRALHALPLLGLDDIIALEEHDYEEDVRDNSVSVSLDSEEEEEDNFAGSSLFINPLPSSTHPSLPSRPL